MGYVPRKNLKRCSAACAFPPELLARLTLARPSLSLERERLIMVRRFWNRFRVGVRIFTRFFPRLFPRHNDDALAAQAQQMLATG
jgi:hypothetical protein